MARLRWTHDRYRFVDHRRGVVADSPGVYEVPDEAVDDYLDHYTDAWERVDEDEDEDEGEEIEGEGEASADEAELETYDRDELEAMEYGELQTLAAEADTDAIDGRSSRDDIVEALSDE